MWRLCKLWRFCYLTWILMGMMAAMIDKPTRQRMMMKTKKRSIVSQSRHFISSPWVRIGRASDSSIRCSH